MNCPSCGNELRRVVNTTGYLNDFQFDSVKAGDYYCDRCKSDVARSGYKYFWKTDAGLKEALAQKEARTLAREQPCGCVICICGDTDKCHGCGAHHCGTHPVGVFDNPVLEKEAK
jgi:hypothetical protein